MSGPVEYPLLSDEALVGLCHGGDALANEELYERYKSIVRMKARPYFLMGADRDDLIQEGMIGLYKAVRDYDPEYGTGFRSFAEMCILRQIISAIKRATRKKHDPLNTYVSIYGEGFKEDGDRPLIDTMKSVSLDNPEDAFISKEALLEIYQSIDSQLSPLEKQVLSLFLGGHSYAYIASALGRSAKSVDNALQRVKHKLEAHVRDEATYK